MKKIFSCIAVLSLLLCTLAISALADTPIIGVKCPETVESGETFDVYITVTEGSGICGGKMTINYDSSVLEMLSITQEPLLSGATVFANVATAKLNWAGVQGIAAGGNLFKVTFKAKSFYEDVFTSVYLSSVKVTDDNAVAINAATVSGGTTVLGIKKPVLSIEAPEEVASGDLFDVSVNLSDDSNVCGGKFSLLYDSTKFAVESAHVGNAVAGASVFVNSGTAGAVRVTFAGLTEISGGEMLCVTFRATEGVLGDAKFTIDNYRMEDANGDNIECESNVCYTKIVRELICATNTTVESRDGKVYFDTRVKNCESDAIVAVALYKDGFLQDIAMSALSGKTAQNVFPECDFDNASIMLWDAVDTMRPLAMAVNTVTASAEFLENLPDFACDILVDADGVISNNNPVLPAEFEGKAVVWSVRGTNNYAVVDNRILSVDTTDLHSETFALTATLSIGEGYPAATKEFCVTATPFYVGQAHPACIEKDFEAELYREDSFAFLVIVPPTEAEGFDTLVRPVGTEIRYSYVCEDANGNAIDHAQNFSVADGVYTITENAVIGSVNTVLAEVGYVLDGEFIVVYTTERTFTIRGRVFTARFDANGGAVMINGEAQNSCAVAEESNLLDGVSASRTGYTLTGWTAEDGTYFRADDFASMPSKDALFTADWTANSYVLTLVHNYPEAGSSSASVTFDSCYVIDAIPERIGYVFDGWYTAEVGGELITAETVVKSAFDHSVYAYWKPLTYTVYFDANGGECATTESSVIFDTTYGTMPTPTRTGYTFTGWFTAEGEEIKAEDICLVVADTTVYAEWIANQYTVTFDANGGITSTASAAVTYTGTYGSLPTPSRTGFGFNGWYTAASGGTVVYDSTTVSIAADHALYAQWTPNTYKLEWYSDTNTCIEVERVVSPYKGEWLGMISYGSPIYYGDVLRVYYTASEGYELIRTGAVNITVTGNLHSEHLYSYARPIDYTYNIVYKSSNGTSLGGTTATYAYGTTNTIYPSAFNGYSTPASQSIKWDSTSAKTITFVYTPSNIASRQQVANGAWDTYNGVNYITYDVYFLYRNRTANSIEVAVEWTNWLRHGYRYGYNQMFNAGINGGWTPSCEIVGTGVWNSSSSSDRTRTVTSNWITVYVTPTQTTVPFESYWWSDGGGDSGHIQTTLSIPTY